MSEKNISKVWPEWSIERMLGSGQYGRVYKASKSDGKYTSYSAIKVITVPADPAEADMLCKNDGIDRDSSRTYFKEIVDGFLNEIRTMDSFKNCPNIVRIEDYKVYEAEDTVSWDIFIRMELLTPVNEYFFNKTPTEEQAAQLGIDICSAIEVLSKKNIVHRDIKPENVFINKNGNYKLGDFGTARVLSEYSLSMTQRVGTPYYMAPEIYVSTKYDSRADIYSLGIVLYRLLNKNRLPFLDSEKQLLSPSERQTAFMKRISGEKLTPPRQASPEMADIILKACAFDPKDRFATATEMKKALQKLIKPDEGREAPTAKRKPKKIRKAPLIAGLAAAFLSVMIVGYSFGYARNTAIDARSNIAAVPKSDVTPAPPQDTSDTELRQAPPALASTDVTTTPEVITSTPTAKTDAPTALPVTTAPVTTLSTTTTLEKTESKTTPSANKTPASVYDKVHSIPGCDITWGFDNGTLYIGGSGRIPDYSDGNKAPWHDIRREVFKIEIGEGVTYVGDMSFCEFFNVTEYMISSTVSDISDHFGTPDSNLLFNISVDENSEYFVTDDYGVLYTKDMTRLLQYPNMRVHEKYVIPDTVKFIDEQAFLMSSNLLEVELPASLETLEWLSFGATAIRRLDIPASVKLIDSAFAQGSASLSEINVDENNKGYSSIDGVLFDKNATTLIAYPQGKTDKSYTVPDTVTAILYNAIFNPQFNEITIPSTVTYIELSAFQEVKDLTVYGEPGSAAEKLARDNGYKFVSK